MRKKQPLIGQVFIGALAGFCYSQVICHFGFPLTGAGHGTAFFAMLAYCPFGIGLFLWPLLGVLAALAGSWPSKVLGRYVLLGYYLWLIVYLALSLMDSSAILATVRYRPATVLLILAIYLFGQALLLRRFFRGTTGDHQQVAIRP